MKKSLFIGIVLLLGYGVVAQNNVGIGTLTPNPQAVLDIESNDRGVLISRLTTIARNTLGTTLTATEDGMLVYDKDLTTFFYWDGPNLLWVQVGSGAGDNWGSQVVQTSGTNISGNGTLGSPLVVIDNDNDPNNEIELPAGGGTGDVLSTDGSGIYTWINDNTGTDNQDIANLVFDNTTNILTVGIENGTAQTVDLTSLLNDGDFDNTNEIQDLSLNTTTHILTITNNGTATNIDLSSYLDNTDAQTLALVGNTLAISGGNNVTLIDNVNDADADPNNEIELPVGGINGQVLSTDGGGNYTWINDGTGTDNQDLNLTGNSLSLTNDGTPVDLSGYLDNTDAQNLTSSVTGGNVTVNISGGIGTTFSIDDADSDPSNEYNTGANLTGDNLNIVDGGGIQTVNLSGIKDHDWYEVGGTTQANNINNDIYTQGNVGIGVVNPTQKIDVDGYVQSDQDFYTTVTFPAGYSIGDYIEFVELSSISAQASGIYEVSVSGTVGNHAAAATYRCAYSHANNYDSWRELPIVGNNGYVGLGQNFTVDINPIAYGSNAKLRIRAINTTGNTATQNYTLNIRVRSLNHNSGWSSINNVGSGAAVTGYAKMTESWMLTTGTHNLNTNANIALSAISNGNIGLGIATPNNKLEVHGRVAQMGYYTNVGRLDIPIDFNGTIDNSTWTRVNENTSVGFRFSDYNSYVGNGQQLYVRMCACWTDNGSNSDNWVIRVKDYDSPTVYYNQNMGNTWSGSGLVHSDCKAWVLANSINCGYGWSGSCYIEAIHDQGAHNLQIKSAWWEIAVK